MTGLALFAVAFLLLMLGYPVAFTFAAVAVFFAAATGQLELFAMMPERIYALMTNFSLMAVPLFIFMGLILQRSGLAEMLLRTIGMLFRRLHGGIAIGTVLVGTILAASIGIVGASVTAMSLIALPVMLQHGYNRRFAAGIICAAGTLGQIIPPSIVLIVLAEVLQVPVGELFRAALLPGLALSGLYIVWTFLVGLLKPSWLPALSGENSPSWQEVVKAIVPPLLLIVLVLGSIFAGIVTPTESAAIGAVGSIALSLLYRRFSWDVLWEAARETARISAMVFTILIGATAFSMVFSYTGGEHTVHSFLEALPGGAGGVLAFSMLLIFTLGFFLDFVEISYIVVPVIAPVLLRAGFDPIWLGVLLGMNLQTSFLTPPFGFSLFYLKGSAPQLETLDIYRGVAPFIALQLLCLMLLILAPELFGLHRMVK
ncbi:C4-dicarboxylate TRAP transporter large permease protein DctM [bacterium HR21]|jgi:tripartite ATP-independent transporter DctM subunit|nr:C4-dicarboxylate TRAP transporter large permease protein DctM [bacterium HR21]